jgi:hypothetical protein
MGTRMSPSLGGLRRAGRHADFAAGHAGDLPGPGSGAVDDEVGQQPHALAGDYVLHLGAIDAAFVHQQVDELVAYPDLAAGGLDGARDGVGGVERVAGGVGHAEDAGQPRVEQGFFGKGRGGGDLLDGDAGGAAAIQERPDVFGGIFVQRHKEAAAVLNSAGQQFLE